MSFLEYAPAPESRAILNLRDEYGLFIDGEFVEGTGKSFATISPADETHIATISAASEADVDAAVAAARRAYDKTWSKMSGRDRGKYLFRIARLVQERARELAVAESLDNGKPIKESRDVDVPLVAAWFFYYAGWADKLDYAGLGADPRALGVAGQVIPWNFPLLMLAWKIAPALRRRQHGRAQARRDHPALGAHLRRDPAAGRPAARCRQHRHRRRRDRRGPGAHPDVDKVAFTGSTGVGRAIAKEVAGSGKKLTLELGGKAANIVFDDAPIDQAIEGIVNGIFFNQGHVCCAGSRLLVQENVHDEVVDRLKQRLSTLRLGDPLDKNTDIGAINSREQLDRIRELSKVGEEEGAERWSADCVIPENGFWFAPTIFTNVQASHRIAREEIFGPVLSVLTFRTPAEAIEKANNTPYGLSAGHLDRQGLPHPRRRRPPPRRRDLGEHLQPVRPVVAVRRLQGVRLRPRGRPPRPGRVPRPRIGAHRRRVRRRSRPRATAARLGASGPSANETGAGEEGSEAMTRLAVPEDVQALHRRRLPAQRVGPHVRDRERQGRLRRERRQGLAQGRPRCHRRRPRRPQGLGGRDRVQPRPGAVPHRRAARGPPRAVRRRDHPARGSQRGRGIRSGRRGDRSLGLVRGLDRQARPGHRQREPGRRSVLQHLGARADRRRRGHRAAGLVAARLRVGGRAPARHRQHGRRGRERAAARCRRSASPRCSRPRMCPAGVVNVLTGSPAEIAPWLASHADVNALDLVGARRLDWVDLQIAAADTLKRVLPPEEGPDAAAPSLDRISAFTETKTVWHTKSMV